MSALDDAIRGAQEQKRERFEISTLKLLLAQLGASKAWITSKEFELREQFGFDWFNDEGLILPQVSTTRVFSYHVADLLKDPEKSPLTEAWHARRQEVLGDSICPFCLIIMNNRLGRIVLDDCGDRVIQRPSCLVTREFTVTSFKNYFSNSFGEDTIEE